MDISVVIPTYNRPSALRAALSALATQTYSRSRFEVIVVDDGSSAANLLDVRSSVSAFEHDIAVTLLEMGANRGKATAVNAGLRATRGSIIALTDDDCVPTSDWITQHLDGHRKRPEQCSIIGPILLPQDWVEESNMCRYVNSRYAGNRLRGELRAGAVPLPPKFFGGGNASVPREKLFSAGLFDETISRSQDVELGLRLHSMGIPLFFSKGAEVLHFANAARDLQSWGRVLARTYKETVPAMQRLHPAAWEKFGHWFLERPTFGRERLTRTLTKLAVRSFIRPSLGVATGAWLRRTDGNKRLFFPAAYHYAITSLCLEAVKERERQLVADRKHGER